jgi:hypothetical protein
VNHFASAQFWECYNRLPPTVRQLADKCFELMKEDPRHPSILLKKAGRYYAARVGLYYRALAVEAPDGLVWF